MIEINYDELKKGKGEDHLLYRTGETKPYTGKANSWYKTGQIKFQGDYKNGVLHGTSTWWARNGTMEYEATYDKGIRQ